MSSNADDLKIGAVFSLASPEKDESNAASDNAGPKAGVAMVTYNDDDDAVPSDSNVTSSVMSSGAKEAFNDTIIAMSACESLLSDNVKPYSSGKSNDEITPTLSTLLRKPAVKLTSLKPNFATGSDDSDAPPCLPKEGVGTHPRMDLSGNLDSIAPPVLHPEVPALTKIKKTAYDAVSLPSPTKKRKIDPSYIVLTKIDPWLGEKSCVPWDDFAQAQNECSNMCKKINFKRRLTRGDDVFNVKTPSKQKDYHVYLEKYEKSQENKTSKKAGAVISIKDLLNRQDKKRRSKCPTKKYLNRVRRTIVHVPVDFKTDTESDAMPEKLDILEDTKKILEDREKELWELKRSRERMFELETLGKLIEIKRSCNTKLKKLKQAIKRNVAQTDGTKSLSGRVRKSNPRYSGYVVDKTEMLEEEILLEMQGKIKYASEVSQRKLKMEEERHCKALEKTFLEVTQKHKQKVDIVIERVDEVEQPKVTKSKPKKKKRKLEKRKKTTTSNAPAFMADIENEISTRREAMRNEKRVSHNKAPNSHKSKATDGVLIQNLPNENSYISDLLKSKSFSPDLSRVKSEPLDSDDSMTSSNAMTSQVRVKTEPLDNGYEQSEQALEEKFKMFKFPEKVKKLFTNKTQPAVSTASSTSPSGATARGINVVHNSKPASPVNSSQFLVLDCPVLQPGIPTTTTKTVASNQALSNKKNLCYTIETNPTSPNQPRMKLTQIVTSNHAGKLSSPYQTTLAPKSVSPTAKHVLANALQGRQPHNPVSVILPRPNMRPQIMFIPVTTTATIAPNIPSAVRARFQVAAKSLVPASVHGQLGSPATHQVCPANKVGNSITSPQNMMSQQKVTVLYPAHHPNSPVQTVASNRTTSLLATSTEPKKVFESNDASVKTAPITGSAVAASPATTNNNAKFYLLKVDGKNILIPLATNRSPPVAYVMNGTSSPLSTTNTTSTTAVASTKSSAATTAVTVRSTTASSFGASNTLVVQTAATPSAVSSPGAPQNTMTQHSKTVKSPTSASRNANVVQAANASQSSVSQTIDPAKSLLNNTAPPYSEINAFMSKKYSPSGIVLQLQTIPTKHLDKTLKYTVSQKTQNGESLKTFAVCDATESSANVSHTTNSGSAHKATTVTKESSGTPKNDVPTRATDVEEKRNASETSPAFLEGVTAREERLRKLKELLKEKQKAVDEIRQQKGML